MQVVMSGGELAGARPELVHETGLDEVRGHQGGRGCGARPQEARGRQLGKRRMQLARGLVRPAVLGGTGEQIRAAAPLIGVGVELRAGSGDYTQPELHMPTHPFERPQQLVASLGEHVGQSLLPLEVGPEAQRQDGAARHDRLDYALVGKDELGRRSRAQGTVSAVDGGEPVALQRSELCAA
jgi:hypothetical protein